MSHSSSSSVSAKPTEVHIEVELAPASFRKQKQIEKFLLEQYFSCATSSIPASSAVSPSLTTSPRVPLTHQSRLPIPTGYDQDICSMISYFKETDQNQSYPLAQTPQAYHIYLHFFVLHADPEQQQELDMDEERNDDTPSYTELTVPHADIFGLWETLVYEGDLKQKLLNYCNAGIRLAKKGVNTKLVTCNRIILLHGPPGTGKTTLCKALAHKIAIRQSHLYPTTLLLEINAHSLFSKWFSETGKLIQKLFSTIEEQLKESDKLIIVLIDEVESLAQTRGSSSADPSDSIRAVNAVLTQLDRISRYQNVLVLATSNLTTNIDLAFLDRVDFKAYVGMPNLQARWDILFQSLCELTTEEVIAEGPPPLSLRQLESNSPDITQAVNYSDSVLFKQIAELADGLSGRWLRRVAFMSFAQVDIAENIPLNTFLVAMQEVVANEVKQRVELGKIHNKVAKTSQP